MCNTIRLKDKSTKEFVKEKIGDEKKSFFFVN